MCRAVKPHVALEQDLLVFSVLEAEYIGKFRLPHRLHGSISKTQCHCAEQAKNIVPY